MCASCKIWSDKSAMVCSAIGEMTIAYNSAKKKPNCIMTLILLTSCTAYAVTLISFSFNALFLFSLLHRILQIYTYFERQHYSFSNTAQFMRSGFLHRFFWDCVQILSKYNLGLFYIFCTILNVKEIILPANISLCFRTML